MKISVILCAHNPRHVYLARVLDRLRAQTLPVDDWELLLVDNASRERLSATVDLSWHHNARHLEESRLGQIHARVRGLRSYHGEIAVFVDDDNVLAPDYLEQAAQIAADWTTLGSWGGSLVAEFEVEPPSWSTEYLVYLALRDAPRDRWGNSTDDFSITPFGAGLCVRRAVAAVWVDRCTNDPRRRGMGRIGEGLGAGEDADLAYTACDIGLGVGVFTRLRVTHLIPKERLTLDYVARLVKETERSQVFLRRLRDPQYPRTRPGRSGRLLESYTLLRMSPQRRRIERARLRGRDEGLRAPESS